MGWQKSGSGSLCYISRRTINGKTVSKYGGTGEKGRLAQLTDENNRLREQVQLLEWQLEESIDQYRYEMAELQIETGLICMGYIRRNRKWIMIDRVRGKLTEVEQATISQAKESKASGKYSDATKPRLVTLDIANRLEEAHKAYAASCKILKIAPSNFDQPIFSKNSSTALS